MAKKSDDTNGFLNFHNPFPQGSENFNISTKPNTRDTYSRTPNRGSTCGSHVNTSFQQDLSDSEESISSQTDSDSVSDPEWIEKVSDKGDLLYVESHPTSNAEDLSNRIDHQKIYFKKRAGNVSENRIHLFQTSTGQTYQASEGEIKEVVINVDSQKHNYGRRTTLCETLLGIIPGEVPDNRSTGLNWDSRRNRIIVKGLAPDGEAMKTRHIKIGDYLVSIDEVEVTAENLVHILSKIAVPRKVKLKIQSSMGNLPIHKHSPIKQLISCKTEKDPIIKYITKAHESFEDVVTFYKRVPHLFLFIRDFNSASSDSVFEDGVLYKYPKYENTLATLSGAFITMNQMSVDVTGGAPISSSLVVDDNLIHVAYHREHIDTLILAIPAKCISHFDIQQIMANLIRILHWQFGILGQAFEDKSNQKTLDQLFILFFHTLLSRNYAAQIHSPIFNTEPFECVPTLLIGHDILAQLDNHLGELESGDFGDMSEAYYDEQRLFLIAGSCLFYKGLLCASHLPKDDLIDLYMYSYYHQILSLTRQEEVAQLIIWREIYPSRIRKQLQDTSNLDFKEYGGRWFVLMIALNHCLIAVLLKTGGCTAVPVAHPPPDPFYVDQIRNTLIKITNLGLVVHLDKSLESSLGPEVSSADSAAAKSKDTKRSLSKQQILNLSRSSSLQTLSWKENLDKRSTSHSNLLSCSPQRRQDVSTMLKKRIQSHLDSEKQQLLTPSIQTDVESDFDRSSDRNEGSSLGMEMSIQTSVSSNSDADSRTSSEDIYRGLKSSRIYGTTFDLSSLKMELENEEDQQSPKLLSGCENTLFQYLTLNTTEGVLISPLHESQDCQFGPLQNEIITNFQRCVSDIHHVFQSTRKNKQLPRNSDIFKNEKGIAPIKEHGVLFKINSSNTGGKKTPAIAYWVVGKIVNVPEQKEIYVCFQDSTSENAIEMAFKLSFGKLGI